MLKDNEDLPEETWPAIRDLLLQLVEPVKHWEEAEIIATPEEMAEHFRSAYPEVDLWPADLRLALHDMKVPFERNEHNNKYYYLAKWK